MPVHLEQPKSRTLNFFTDFDATSDRGWRRRVLLAVARVASQRQALASAPTTATSTGAA